jgi:hypothetical protein
VAASNKEAAGTTRLFSQSKTRERGFQSPWVDWSKDYFNILPAIPNFFVKKYNNPNWGEGILTGSG